MTDAEAIALARSTPDRSRLRVHPMRVGRLQRECWRSQAWREERYVWWCTWSVRVFAALFVAGLVAGVMR